MKEEVGLKLKGHIRIYEQGNPKNMLYSEDNVIVNTVKSLFARLMANSIEPAYGVWGLALGAGSPAWADSQNQEEEQPTQTHLYQELRRKQISFVRFVDSDLNPVQHFSERVSFQTVVNSTNDALTDRPIREMGLIGGGHNTLNTQGQVIASTDMGSARFWNPSIDLVTRTDASTNNPAQTVTLINYKTLPPLILAPNLNYIFDWVLSF